MADDRCSSAWQLVKLSDLGEVNRGRSRHRPRYAEHLYGGPYPFIQTGDIRESGGRITSYKQTYSEAGLAQSRMWPAGTMCITIAANIAETAILTFPACFPDSVVGFIADESKCDVRFVEYVFRFLRRRIQHEASGSVQDNINLATLERLQFPLPDLSEQKAIAHILGTLDDKIELNRRMNRTLEEMARAIFKSWFVDFDPVRAKADGRWRRGQSLPGLPAHLYDLFPSRLVASEPGEIPAGWHVGPLLSQVTLLSGGTPKTDRADYWNGTVHWASAKDVSQCSRAFLIATERTISHKGLENSATQLIPALSTVVVARGATTGRMVMLGREMAMNQTCYALVSKLGAPFALHCQIGEAIAGLVHAAHGSVFDTITTSTFNTATLVIPPRALLLAFEGLVSPCFRRVLEIDEDSRTLARLRDALLPKLVSGEVRLRRVRYE